MICNAIECCRHHQAKCQNVPGHDGATVIRNGLRGCIDLHFLQYPKTEHGWWECGWLLFCGGFMGYLPFLHIPLRKWFGKFPSDKTRWLFRGKMLMRFSSKNLREDLPTVKLQPSIAQQFVIFWSSPWRINLKEGKLGTCLRQLFLQKLRIQTDDTPPWIKRYFLLKMGIS